MSRPILNLAEIPMDRGETVMTENREKLRGGLLEAYDEGFVVNGFDANLFDASSAGSVFSCTDNIVKQ
jgi:hypothetical protein